MSLTSRTKILGVRCNEYLRKTLRPDAPVKHLADILGQSRQTAARIFQGELPTTAQLVALADYFGPTFVAEMFEPLVGGMDDAKTGATLDRIEELLVKLRSERRNEGGELENDVPSPASSIRMSLREIDEYPLLKMTLEQFQSGGARMELSDAIGWARADPEGRSNINVKAPGDVFRFAYRGRANRLRSTGEDYKGRPVTTFSDKAYAALTAYCCAEAEQSPEPILARLAGSFNRTDGRVISGRGVVLRTLNWTRNGAALLRSRYIVL